MADAVEVVGRSGSVSNDGASAELVYQVWGTSDDATAQAAALAEAPAAHRGLPVVGSSINESEGGWEVRVRYNSRDIPVIGESEYQFDTGGGTVHIAQSLETVGSYAPDGETAPDYQGLIGVSDRSVEGVDISTPVFSFSETHIISAALVTTAFKVQLHELTATVNNATFRGLAAGAVLFLGASGSARGVDDWSITYKFAAGKNVSGLSIGEISGIDKGAWDYLWVRYKEVKDEDAKRIVRRPAAVYVERVYGWGNYGLLGI